MALSTAIADFAEVLDNQVEFEVDLRAAPDWSVHLDQLRKSIVKQINPPGALSSGHRSLADKCGVEVFKWHLRAPSSQSLKRIFLSVRLTYGRSWNGIRHTGFPIEQRRPRVFASIVDMQKCYGE